MVSSVEVWSNVTCTCRSQQTYSSVNPLQNIKPEPQAWKSLNISINIFIQTSIIIENNLKLRHNPSESFNVVCQLCFTAAAHMRTASTWRRFLQYSQNAVGPLMCAIICGFPSFNIQFHWSDINNLSVLFPPFKCFPSLAFKSYHHKET